MLTSGLWYTARSKAGKPYLKVWCIGVGMKTLHNYNSAHAGICDEKASVSEGDENIFAEVFVVVC